MMKLSMMTLSIMTLITLKLILMTHSIMKLRIGTLSNTAKTISITTLSQV
jgi:hypothetical protein